MYTFAAAGERLIQTPETQRQNPSTQSAVPASMSRVPMRFTRFLASVDAGKLKGRVASHNPLGASLRDRKMQSTL